MSFWLLVKARFAAFATSWTANVWPPAVLNVTLKVWVPASAAVKV